MDWWHTEGARGGYRRDAPADARQAHALKKLTSLPAVVGDAVHQAAAARARAVRDGMRPPGFTDLLDRVRARLNRAVSSRDVGAFLTNPSDRVMLREVYFGEWPGGAIPREVVDATKVRVSAALRRVIEHPAWEDLARCGRGDILVCDTLDALEMQVDGVRVKAFAAPDLVWVSRGTVTVPGFGVPLLPPVTTILDWTTGRSDGRIDAKREQLAVYAWWATRKFTALAAPAAPTAPAAPAAPAAYVGRVADLSAAAADEADIQHVLRPEDIEQGGRLIERAATAIVAARDPDGTVPMERTTRNLGACRWCPFTPLCIDRVS